MILKVLQWNAHKSLGPAGVSELNTILINENIPIALLQEMGRKDTKPNFPERDWNIYGSGNAGILIHKNLRSILLPEYSTVTENFSTVAASVYLDELETPITFISVYRNTLSISEDENNSQNSRISDRNIFLDWLENTITQLPTQCESFVIGGDYNIRAKELGSHKDDNGAVRLITLGLSLNPEGCILNDGSITRQNWITSEKNIHPSSIDVTMVHANESSDIVFTDWKTNGTGLSDHMRITFNINYNAVTPQKNEMKTGNGKKYKTNHFSDNESKLIAFAEFVTLLTNAITEKGWIPPNDTHPNIVPHIDPDITVNEMNTVLIQSAITSKLIKPSVSPRKFLLSQSRNFAWDEQCDEKLKERRQCARSLSIAKKSYIAFVEELKKSKKRNHFGEIIQTLDSVNEQKKALLHSKLVMAKTAYNKSIGSLRKAIKNASQNSWMSAIESIKHDTPIKTLWQTVNKLGRRVTKRPTHRRPFLLKDNHGVILSKPIQQANCLATHWQNISKNVHMSYSEAHFERISTVMNQLRDSFSPLVPRTKNEAVQLVLELPRNVEAKWQSKLTMEELKRVLSSINTAFYNF